MEVRKGFTQTEIGFIPESWEIMPIKDVASVKTGPFGSTLHEKDYVPDGTPIITVEHLSEQGVVHSTLPMVSDFDLHRLSAYSLILGDIVFSRVGSVDRNSLISERENGWLFSGRLLRVRSQSKKLHTPFLSYYFHSEPFKQRIRSVAVGQTMASLNTQIMNAILVVVPPLPEQQAIAAALSDVDTLLASLDALIAKKRLIKQGVMQELLTGKQRLPGFSGEWAAKPFDDVLLRINAKSHQILASDYQSSGRYPVVDQGKEPVIGYSDRQDKCFRCPKGGVIVFGDHTCIVKFVDFDFLVGADGTQVLQAKDGQHTRFYAFQLQLKGITPTGYNRHFKFLKERTFLTPPLTEQTAIAEILSDMDADLSALEARREKTRLLKQGMMQELLTGRIRLV